MHPQTTCSSRSATNQFCLRLYVVFVVLSFVVLSLLLLLQPSCSVLTQSSLCGTATPTSRTRIFCTTALSQCVVETSTGPSISQPPPSSPQRSLGVLSETQPLQQLSRHTGPCPTQAFPKPTIIDTATHSTQHTSLCRTKLVPLGSVGQLSRHTGSCTTPAFTKHAIVSRQHTAHDTSLFANLSAPGLLTVVFQLPTHNKQTRHRPTAGAAKARGYIGKGSTS
eukprot:m.70315 g.70315  ORF g.70315 m.70315 type:complete len:223 (+) comp14060_c0_seq2:240-908(+)